VVAALDILPMVLSKIAIIKEGIGLRDSTRAVVSATILVTKSGCDERFAAECVHPVGLLSFSDGQAPAPAGVEKPLVKTVNRHSGYSIFDVCADRAISTLLQIVARVIAVTGRTMTTTARIPISRWDFCGPTLHES